MKGLALLSPRVSSPLLGTSRTSRSQSFCLLAAFFILALTTLIYLRSESLLDYLVAPAYQRFVMTPVDPSTAVDARPGWMPFQRPDEITFEPAFRPSLAQKVMSASCADDWVTRMEVCEEMRDGRVQKAMLEALHAVISWVNGTDAIMGASRTEHDAKDREAEASDARKSGSNANHYRSHGELVHNLRGIVQSYPLPTLKHISIFASDVAAHPTTPSVRLGQLPYWLDSTTLNKQLTFGMPSLGVLFPSNLFRVARSTTHALAPQLWRDNAIPSFSSLAIESQLPNIKTTADALVYLNDDFFTLKKVATSDLHSLLFGPMLRFGMNQYMQSRKYGSSGASKEGEWPGLEHTNWLLSNRFGSRPRNYLSHIPKTLPTYILDEISYIWAEELASTATVRFRGRGPEVQLGFATTHYIVERHREVLLWSLLFAKHDSDRSGTFSLVERTSFLSYLHNASLPFSANDAVLPIRRPYRESSSRFLPSYEAIDVPPPSTTEPRFLSGDGYTLVRNLGNDPWQFPVFTMPADASPACKLDLVTCFGTDFMSAEEGEVDAAAIMRRLAVEEPRCGDCLITAGLAQSGTVGLEGFLPPAEDGGRTARLTERAVRPPLLALTKRYEDATWSWDEVEGQLDAFDGLRDFAVRLIQRYSHTVGDSPYHFIMVERPGGLRRNLERTRHEPRPAFLGINDDIQMTNLLPEIDDILHRFFISVWPHRTPWEKTSVPVDPSLP